MKKSQSPYYGFRFPAAVIGCAVRWYHRFNLSLRDIEELLLERGVVVTYESVRNWCDRFGAMFACRAQAARPRPATTWHLDEVFVKLRGEPYVLWRAVDEHGIELDVLLQKRRDTAAAKRFFERVLRSHPAPRKIVTDQLRSYPGANTTAASLLRQNLQLDRVPAVISQQARNMEHLLSPVSRYRRQFFQTLELKPN
jgi:putative transposase